MAIKFKTEVGNAVTFSETQKLLKLELFILGILLSKILVLCELIYLLLIWKESKDLKKEQQNL